MKRTDKRTALKSLFTGNTRALKQYWQASRQPVLLMVQKEPKGGYSIKPDANRPELPAGLLTETEYNEVLESLRKRSEPVICIIRTAKEVRYKSEV